MSPSSCTRAVSQRQADFTFQCIENVPKVFEERKRTTHLLIGADSCSTIATTQALFDRGDSSLIPLSTSGDITDYETVSVDKNRVVQFRHKLPYIMVLSTLILLQCYLM